MSHTYVVTSAVHSASSDFCIIIGTVDGFPVTITIWFSAIASLPNTTAVQNFIAPLMLAQAVANGSVAPVAGTTVPTVTAAGTFTQ